MKISKITVWQKSLPLTKPYWLSGGRLKFEKLESTFIRIDTDEGISGWGEACPWGNTYLPAHGGGVCAALQILAPALLGCDPCALQQINEVMDINLPGHLYAKSPLDMACWDIFGQVAAMPLWRLMGAAQAEEVAVNSSISHGTPEAMLADIRAASAQGYRAHSAKIGGDDSAADIARIETISQALPANEQVTFDVNRAWTPGLALQVLGQVTSRDWVEQPCETLRQCADIAGKIAQPIMLDEVLHTFDDHLQAWRLAACQGVKVKPNRVGGLTKARQIIQFGSEVGWQMHVEEVGGSALADTAAIHLATSVPRAHRLASWLCHYHLAVDPVPGQGARNQNGIVVAPDKPGLGVCPDEELLGEAVAVYGSY